MLAESGIPIKVPASIVGRNMLRAFGHPVVMYCKCCDLLGVVGSNLKLVKFFMQHLIFIYMLHVVVVWPGSCNNVAPGHAHYFDFQYPTCRNTSQQGGQTRARCCAQRCCDVLCLQAGAWKCWANNARICCDGML